MNLATLIVCDTAAIEILVCLISLVIFTLYFLLTGWMYIMGVWCGVGIATYIVAPVTIGSYEPVSQWRVFIVTDVAVVSPW